VAFTPTRRRRVSLTHTMCQKKRGKYNLVSRIDYPNGIVRGLLMSPSITSEAICIGVT